LPRDSERTSKRACGCSKPLDSSRYAPTKRSRGPRARRVGAALLAGWRFLPRALAIAAPHAVNTTAEGGARPCARRVAAAAGSPSGLGLRTLAVTAPDPSDAATERAAAIDAAHKGVGFVEGHTPSQLQCMAPKDPDVPADPEAPEVAPVAPELPLVPPTLAPLLPPTEAPPDPPVVPAPAFMPTPPSEVPAEPPLADNPDPAAPPLVDVPPLPEELSIRGVTAPRTEPEDQSSL
jgi:hypothetical protein